MAAIVSVLSDPVDEPQHPTGVMARPELDALRSESEAPPAEPTARYIAPVLGTPSLPAGEIDVGAQR